MPFEYLDRVERTHVEHDVVCVQRDPNRRGWNDPVYTFCGKWVEFRHLAPSEAAASCKVCHG